MDAHRLRKNSQKSTDKLISTQCLLLEILPPYFDSLVSRGKLRPEEKIHAEECLQETVVHLCDVLRMQHSATLTTAEIKQIDEFATDGAVH
jgi:hypothetical protein